MKILSQKLVTLLPLFFATVLVMIFTPLYGAIAQEAAAPPAAKSPSILESLLPFAVMIGIFYFLIIRPQGQRQKAQQKILSELKRGDEVVTSSGILGRIEGLTDLYVTLEIANDVRIKILRTQIAGTHKDQITQAQQGKA